MYRKWQGVRILEKPLVQEMVEDLYKGSKKFLDWGLNKTEIVERLENIIPFNFRQFVCTVYELYMAKKDPEARIWGDKNPIYISHMSTLKTLFPSAKLIHIVRDGRAVYHSFINANRKHGKIYPEKPWKAAAYWRSAINVPADFLKDKNYIELSYENLVQGALEELKRLCDFLKVEYLPEPMLSFHEQNQRLGLVPASRLKWHEATLKGIDQRKINEWRMGLKRSQVFLFELVAGKELKEKGYQLLFPGLGIRILNRVAAKCMENFS